MREQLYHVRYLALFSCTTVRWNNQLNSVSGGTSSVTVQRTAQGRVTSDCPTIELCDRAR